MVLGPRAQERYDRLSQIPADQLKPRQQKRLNILTRRMNQPAPGSSPRQFIKVGDKAVKGPGKTIGTSQRVNLNTAQQSSQLSNPNVNNPFGNQQVTFDEYGRPVVNQNLSPTQQGLLDQETGLESGFNQRSQELWSQANPYSSPFSLNGAPEAPMQQGFEQFRQQQIDSDMQDFERQYGAQFQQQQDDLERWSRETGNAPGSQQYNYRAQILADNQNRARQSQLASAQQRAQSAVESGFDLSTQARQNWTDEQLLQRDRPVQEISGLMGLGMGVQLPNFPGFQGSQVAPTDVGGISTGYADIGARRDIAQQGYANQLAVTGANNAAAAARDQANRDWADSQINNGGTGNSQNPADDSFGKMLGSRSGGNRGLAGLGRRVRQRR